VRVGGKLKMEHRVVFEQTYGLIPDGLFVCHRCDNRECINPEHLALGSQSQNVRDCMIKGRRGCTRGPNKGEPTLTVAQVLEIRERLKTPIYGLGSRLAKEFGVGTNVISRIKTRTRWSYI
jgi:hypothetical protein